MRLLALATIVLMLSPITHSLHAAEELPDKDAIAELIAQGERFLLDQHQEDGSFMPYDQAKLGITAVVLNALMTEPLSIPKDDPRIQAAYQLLIDNQQPDGGIYFPREGFANYITSLTLMLAEKMGTADEPWVEKAQNYLIGIQNVEPNSIFNGGIGYGSRGEGHEDLNNTTYAILALRGTGVPADDPAMQRALKFVQRCQNLSSHNPMDWAGSDGGAVYSPDSSKVSSQPTGPADEQADRRQAASGRLRSYGSMTYSLISSYIALDLEPGDPRLDAALDWVKNNYRFDVNPGMGPGQERQGLYYYLNMMSKTFDTLGLTELDLPAEGTADWRADLFAAIQDRAQAIDGASEPTVMWINEADRWAEGLPPLVTAYMVQSLKRIHQSL